MKSAWLNLRGRYFVGPYSDTPDITLLGPPPCYVLDEPCEQAHLGRVIGLALHASRDEAIPSTNVQRVSDERGLELPRLAGVKDLRGFERGNRYVSFDCLGDDHILVTPYLRKRGYWDPAPQQQWITLKPLRHRIGEAAITAAERAEA